MINQINTTNSVPDKIEKTIEETYQIDALEKENKLLNKQIHFHLLGGTHADEINAFEGFSSAKQLHEKNIKSYKNINFHIVNEKGILLDKEIRTREDENGEDPNRPGQALTIKESLLKKININQDKIPYFIDFHNCPGNYSLGLIKNYENSNQNDFQIKLAKSLGLDAIVLTDPRLPQLDIIETTTKSKGGLGMLVEVGNDIEKEKKSFKIAKKLLEMSKEVYEDGKEFGYIEDINNSESKMPETKIFKVSIIDNNEREKLIVSGYKGISFQQRGPFIIKIEKSIDGGKSFRSIDEEDEKLIQV